MPRPTRTRTPSRTHIPRPRNPFIIFRNAKQREYTGGDQGNISKAIGKRWRDLPAEERAVYEQMAEREKAEHARLYPGYRFRPRTKQQIARDKQLKEEKGTRRAAAAEDVMGSGLDEQASSSALLEIQGAYSPATATANLCLPIINCHPLYASHRAVAISCTIMTMAPAIGTPSY
ncbi:Specific transcriptional repressor [Mycena kentingensis (nom. inval.)]|nr:Specific transcriptional repressor [Mycena kentingensis (nom. inval.)]